MKSMLLTVFAALVAAHAAHGHKVRTPAASFGGRRLLQVSSLKSVLADVNAQLESPESGNSDAVERECGTEDFEVNDAFLCMLGGADLPAVQAFDVVALKDEIATIPVPSETSPLPSPAVSPVASPAGTPASSPAGTPASSPAGTPAETPAATSEPTPAGSPAASLAGTPAASPTGTAAASPAATSKSSAAASPASSPAASAEATPVPSPAESPAGTAQVTPSPAVSVSPARSPGATPEPSTSQAPSPSAAATVSPARSALPTLEPLPSMTSAPSAEPSTEPSPSQDALPSAEPSPESTPEATPSPLVISEDAEEKLAEEEKPFFVTSVALRVSGDGNFADEADRRAAMENVKAFYEATSAAAEEARLALRRAIADAITGLTEDSIVILGICIGRCSASSSGSRRLRSTRLLQSDDSVLDVQYAVLIDEAADYSSNERLSAAAESGNDVLVAELQRAVGALNVQTAVMDTVAATVEEEDELAPGLVNVDATYDDIINNRAATAASDIYVPAAQEQEDTPTAQDEEDVWDKILTTPIYGAVGGVAFVGLFLVVVVTRRRRSARQALRAPQKFDSDSDDVSLEEVYVGGGGVQATSNPLRDADKAKKNGTFRKEVTNDGSGGMGALFNASNRKMGMKGNARGSDGFAAGNPMTRVP